MFLRAIIPAATALVLALAAAPALRAEIAIEEVVSPGGISAWLVEEHSIPMVALRIGMRGGAGLDEPGRRGATYAVSWLMNEGAGDLDAQAFAARAEELAAQLSFNVSDDTFEVSATMLSENIDEAAALLALALTEPRFDPDAIERMRADTLQSIARDAMDPTALAVDRLFALAYPGHPYGSDLKGTAESVAALTRDDIVTAWRNALTRGDLHVGVVGDITPERLGVLLDTLLGGLPEAGPPRPPRVDWALGGGTTLVDFPTPQSVAVFGQRGVGIEDPRYFAAALLNTVLGDGMESRLMQELRERRGLTYGVSTHLVARDLSPMMLGMFATSNATMAEAADLVRAEWARIAADGITQEELDFAKTYMTGEYPLRFDGNGAIAAILMGMQMLDLPPEYVTHRNDYVNAVTLEQVNRVAAELFDPAALHFVIAGQPEGIEAAGSSGAAESAP
ncbi:MAG: insulinase family protein [Rubellimicrobium sp.]|nr:insulinase family protein [Rubellimicrobium sp.]